MQSQKVKEVRIKGTVKDEKGHLLPGVTVFIKGLQIGTVTDGDGRFTIAIPDMESIVLQFLLSECFQRRLNMRDRRRFMWC